jgi:transcription initiation factor TFIIH subunit 4
LQLKQLRILGHKPLELTTYSALAVGGLVEVTEESQALSMNGSFRKSLAAAIAAEHETPWEDETLQLPPLREQPGSEEIETMAAMCWNSILHYLVGSDDAPEPSAKVVELLVSTNLLGVGAGTEMDLVGGEVKPAAHLSYTDILAAGDNQVHITRAGYEFLMKDTSIQLWTFMNEYLRTAARRGMDTADILAFLFQLGFCRLGEGYATGALKPTQQRLLKDFAAFGLVHQPEIQLLIKTPQLKRELIEEKASGRKKERRRFFPTSLAIVLTQPDTTSESLQRALATSAALHTASSVADVAIPPGVPDGLATNARAASRNSGKLYIIAEKNFKVYAYTSVDLHLALVALFAHIEVRLPNLVVATLTRRSVLRAMEKGITAELIYHFLESHAHPAVLTKVPENVADQLSLWEQERQRISVTQSVVMLDGFPTQSIFDDCLTHLQAKGAVLKCNQVDRLLFVSEKVGLEIAKRRLAGLQD